MKRRGGAAQPCGIHTTILRVPGSVPQQVLSMRRHGNTRAAERHVGGAAAAAEAAAEEEAEEEE